MVPAHSGPQADPKPTTFGTTSGPQADHIRDHKRTPSRPIRNDKPTTDRPNRTTTCLDVGHPGYDHAGGARSPTSSYAAPFHRPLAAPGARRADARACGRGRPGHRKPLQLSPTLREPTRADLVARDRGGQPRRRRHRRGGGPARRARTAPPPPPAPRSPPTTRPPRPRRPRSPRATPPAKTSQSPGRYRKRGSPTRPDRAAADSYRGQRPARNRPEPRHPAPATPGDSPTAGPRAGPLRLAHGRCC